MSRLTLAILVTGVLSVGHVAAEDGRDVTGSVGVVFGFKDLRSGWDPLSDQWGGGLLLTIGQERWPVLIALDYLSFDDEETRTLGFPLFPPFCCFEFETVAKSETEEWDLGVRRGWRKQKAFRPYLGGGVAFIEGKIKIDEPRFRADDSTTGYWLEAGFRAGRHRYIEWGLDLRYSEGSIDLGSESVEAGGKYALFFVGGRW
jgi:hypothetical protein